MSIFYGKQTRVIGFEFSRNGLDYIKGVLSIKNRKILPPVNELDDNSA